MARIALVTHRGLAELVPGDLQLKAAIEARGVEVRAVPWDAQVDWSGFDLLIIRATWDYFLRGDEFFRWLEARRDSGRPMWNPADLALWNADKRYLRELEQRGVSIPPTHWVERGEQVALGSILEAHAWTEAVVKPAISGGAHGTFRVRREDAAASDAKATALAQGSAVLVQPFLPEILGGEVSVVTFEGRPSHVVRKRPVPGEFRVQSTFGGQYERIEAPPGILETAKRVLEALGRETLYARVDLVETARGPLLMELELIEPDLYLDLAPGAPDRFAGAIVRRLG